MCGILGICLSDGHSMKDKKVEIKALLKQLFVETQIRGRISTGIAAITNKRVIFMKGKLKATSFVQSEEFDNFMDNVLLLDSYKDEYLYSIIGHCRYDTKGSPDDNKNNHPIVTDNMIGIHNGMISNDEEIFDKFNAEGIKRKGLVDSESIFQLIDLFYKKEIGKGYSTLSAIKKACAYFKGSMTCALLNRNEPQRLYLFRNRMDALSVVFYGDYGMTVFCSNKSFIDTAFEESFDKSTSKVSTTILNTTPDSVLTIDLRHKLCRNEATNK